MSGYTVRIEVSQRVRLVAQGDTKFHDRWPDWLIDLWPARTLQRLLCRLGGHTPIADHCGIPEHDYCAWCQKSMPCQAEGGGDRG